MEHVSTINGGAGEVPRDELGLAGACRPSFSPLRTSNEHIHRPAAAPAANKPSVPIRDGHLGAVALGDLGRVRFDLMPAIASSVGRGKSLSKILGFIVAF